MQTSSQPQAATVPAQPTPPPVSITVTRGDGAAQTLAIPRTREAMDELVAQRAELSDQLVSAPTAAPISPISCGRRLRA